MSMGIAVVMLVLAMLVVVMVTAVMVMIAMIMVVMMIMRMIVAGVAMTAVVVRVFRMRVSGRVGAAFGIERRLDLNHARAQPLHHRLDDVIPADAQAFAHDLCRQMAVAEMPGDPHQVQGIGTLDLDQRLRRCDHLDQPAVFQHQRIAAAQRNGVFEIKQEF